jgi:hypothetical protein
VERIEGENLNGNNDTTHQVERIEEENLNGNNDTTHQQL